MNNNTTTVGPPINYTITYPLDYYYSFFTNSLLVVRFYQIGYPITFILGFIGNIASLATFSRLTLRRISTGCLFIILAISDTIFLLMCIFDFLEFGLKVPFYHHVQYDELCRFRSFVMRFAQVLSAWTLVTVSADRWIRTRFPFKSGSICTPRNALIAVSILSVMDVALYSHVLTPLYGMLIPGFSILACGPTIYSGSYLIFYLLYWTIVEILVIYLIPACLILFLLIDIFIVIRLRKRAVIHPVGEARLDQKAFRQKHLQLQMFVMMIASIVIFLTTNLPISIYKITSPREQDVSISLLRITGIWTGLGWFQTLNYAMNFYIHCLTSTLFRKEFVLQVRYLDGERRTRVLNTNDFSVTGHRTLT